MLFGKFFCKGYLKCLVILVESTVGRSGEDVLTATSCQTGTASFLGTNMESTS